MYYIKSIKYIGEISRVDNVILTLCNLETGEIEECSIDNLPYKTWGICPKSYVLGIHQAGGGRNHYKTLQYNEGIVSLAIKIFSALTILMENSNYRFFREVENKSKGMSVYAFASLDRADVQYMLVVNFRLSTEVADKVLTVYSDLISRYCNSVKSPEINYEVVKGICKELVSMDGSLGTIRLL